MYDNIGGKIKGLAKAVFIIEAIAAVITGIVLMGIFYDEDEGLTFIGLLVLVLGPLVAWVSSWLIYGFGEIIDKLCDIERNTCGGERKSEEQSKNDCKKRKSEAQSKNNCEKRKSEAQSKLDDERISRIEKLRSQGLITEEEYQQAISKKQ